MGCLFSKYDNTIFQPQKNTESNKYDFLFDSDEYSYLNPISVRKSCKYDNLVIFV
jgi:hypothetical protein